MGSIPRRYRAALRADLDALPAGRRPELLTWVQAYGPAGAQLIRQPEEVWTHPGADFGTREDGSAWVTLPLWTREESPSDLSVECEISPSGAVTLEDLHVL